jgi:dihydrofolate synthase/folylpolyglutamate synthase
VQDKPSNKASLLSWLSYIEEIHFNQIDLGLERVFQVKEKACITPNFPIILVGGTNGKGSTCAFIESILNESNLNVGCYTSPHFINFNERIRINKNEVSDKKIVNALNYVENKRDNISLTYFELTTLAAVEVFIKEKVDIAILEVGLGGRLDAVNIFDPIASIITTVSLDHQNYLGDTVEAIAYEKAGIFRPKKPAIINYKNPILPLITSAKKIDSNINILNKDYKIFKSNSKLKYKSDISIYNSLPYPKIKGNHQMINLAGALRCIDFIKDFFPISEEEVIKGINHAHIKGRFEVLNVNPFVVYDVAHNQEASINLASNFVERKLQGKTIAVFSIMTDKDIQAVVEPFINIVDEWYIAKNQSQRSASVEQIEKDLLTKKNIMNVHKFDSLNLAYQEALNKCQVDDNILMFGSFFVNSEVFQ